MASSLRHPAPTADQLAAPTLDELLEEESSGPGQSSWRKLRTVVSASAALRNARVAAAVKPWKRADSFSQIASPWRSSKQPTQECYDFEAPPPHAANCPCCKVPAQLFSPRPRSESQDAKRTTVLRRWHAPLLALRVERLTPLRIASEAELDLPLPQCPATTSGTLPNGLSYMVRSCDKPAGRVVLRLAFRVGSLAEADDQLGMAHLLEHCAFLKLQSFGKGELISFLESIGAQFGADLNAHTAFTETVYKLNVPIDGSDGPALLAKSFAILGEWASGVIIDDALLETERTVVNEEWRGSLGVGDRLFRTWLQRVFGHERLASRLPIGGKGDADGLRCVLHGAPQRLRDFYQTHYRPELAAVIVVGDFASRGGHQPIIDLIETHLGGWARSAAANFALPAHHMSVAPRTAPGAPAAAIVSIDAELSGSSVEIGLVLPPQPWARTAAHLLRSLERDIWQEVLNFRLAQLIETAGADPPYAAASSGTDSFEGAGLFELSAQLRTESHWEGALAAMLDEGHRLLLHGASEHEVRRVVKNYDAGLQMRYKERHDVEAPEIAAELVTHFLHDGETCAHVAPEYLTRLLIALLRRIDAVSVSAAGRAHLGAGLDSPSFVRFIGPRAAKGASGEVVSEAALLAVVDAASQRAASGALLPPKVTEPPSAAPLFETCATLAAANPATLTSATPLTFSCTDHEHLAGKPLEAGHWVMSNGATVTWCRTPFEADTITFEASALGGYRERPAHEHEALWWSALETARNGLGQLSSIELGEALAGLDASGRASVGRNGRSLEGSCGSDALETALQLAWASAKRARFDEAALARAVRNWQEEHTLQAREPSYHFVRKVSELVHGASSAQHQISYSEAHFRRQLAALEAPHATATMAALHRTALGAAAAGCWSFVLVGALPPNEELRAILERTLGAFDSPPETALHPPETTRHAVLETARTDASETTPPPAVTGWLAAPERFPRRPKVEEAAEKAKARRSRPWRAVRTATVRAGTEETSRTLIVLPADPAPYRALEAAVCGAADNPSDAASRALTYAREVACAVAEVALRKELREARGLVYSISCAYEEDATTVAFTCAPDTARACVRHALRTLWKAADGEVSAAEVAAVLEQHKRQREEALIRNGFYASVLSSAVMGARLAPSWADEAAVHERAGPADVDFLRQRVLLHSRLHRPPPTLAAVKKAAQQCFPRRRRVVVTMIPERTWAECARNALLASAVIATVAVAVVAARRQRMR